jgi:hypothetical protein
MNEYDEKWEAQINALLEGELSAEAADLLKAKADEDHELARAIIEAYQLQKVMDDIQIERAPRSLRKKLLAVPRQHRAMPAFSLLQPRWVAAVAVVPLVFVALSLMQPDTPSAQEIEKARQDLAIAFAYLDKAGQLTGREIESTVGNTMSDAIAGSVIRNIKSQYGTPKENEA